MSPPRSIVITETVLRALWFINSYRYLAVSQVAIITGLKPKSASEMLLRLERQKLLGSFGNVGIRGYGKTPKLYYLTRTGYGLLSEHAEAEGWAVEPYRQVSGSTRWSPIMFHRLDVLDALMALERDVGRAPGYELIDTLVEYRRRKVAGRWQPETADYVANPPSPENRIVPDAGFVLARRDSGKRVLFLIEVDRGTERLTTTRAEATAQTFTFKMRQYDRYLSSGRLQERYADLGPFVGWWVLTMTTSQERVENMRQALPVCDRRLHQLYRLSTLAEVKKNFLHANWLSRDSGDCARHQLIRGD